MRDLEERFCSRILSLFARRTKEVSELFVAGLADGRKVVVGGTPGYRESVESCLAVLRDLRERGMNAPRVVIGDGHVGIWGALRNVWPEADEQRCWEGSPPSPGTWWGIAEVLNVLEQLPRQRHAAAKPMLRAIAYAPTRAEAERKRKAFEEWCYRHGYGKAAETLGRS